MSVSLATASKALLVLNWASWLILMGGTASIQSSCQVHAPSASVCAKSLALTWWIVSFQCFILIITTMSLCLRPTPGLQTACTHLTVMVTSVMMYSADGTYRSLEGLPTLNNLSGKFPGDLLNRLTAYFVGVILSMTWNILLVFVSSFSQAKSTMQEPSRPLHSQFEDSVPAGGPAAMYVQSQHQA